MQQQERMMGNCDIEEISIRIADLKLAIQKAVAEIQRARDIGTLKLIKRKKEFLEETLRVNEEVYGQLRRVKGNEVH